MSEENKKLLSGFLRNYHSLRKLPERRITANRISRLDYNV